MRPVSTEFLEALRTSHTPYITVDARQGGAPIATNLAVLSGQVTAEASRTASPRRSLNIELAPARGLWDLLSPAGVTLVVYRGVRFLDGTVEKVQLGIFDVDEQSLDYGPGGGLTLTAPDIWVRVTRARFEAPRVFAGGSAVDTAVSLATQATSSLPGVITADMDVSVRRTVWERDRDDAIAELARAAGAWIYADFDGTITARPVPSLSQAPVWTVDASASGVMLSADRSRSRQRTYNVVVVSATETDGTVPYAPVTVADTDPLSPTYASGPFGRVPYFYSNQLLTGSSSATTAAKAILRRTTGLAAQLDLTSVVNPALEPGDVIEVLLPARDGDTPRVERHLIDSVTIPLTADGTQSIQTRSTRPEGDVPAET